MKRFLRIFLFGCLTIGMLYGGSVRTEAKTPDEYDLKVVFLYRFLSFISWPEHTVGNGTLDMCILGQDPFGKRLKIIENQKTPKRQIRVRRGVSFTDFPSCHILFIAQSEKEWLRKVLDKTETLPLLTVSDIPEFAAQGGMIGFITDKQRKIKFEVNLKSANQANVKIDAQMLEVAQRVVDR